MASTITELASRLKLSKGTVSRILNNTNAPFSAETRRRVFSMAAEMGYQPNPVARALVTGKTGFIALCLKDLISAYHAHVAHYMEASLERHGFYVAVALCCEGNIQYGPDSRNRAERAVPLGVDGVIAHESPWPMQDDPQRQRAPVISTGAYCDPRHQDFVGVDLYPAAIAAVQHLIEPGRKRVAFLTCNIPYQGGDARFKAYSYVMNEAGLPLEFIESMAEYRPRARQAVRDYITENGCPEAIFCHNDEIALATYRALCDLGIRVPDDVALFGCDGIQDGEYLPASLSTIAQPFEALCETASRFLEHRINEPDAPPQQIVLQPKLLIRESSQNS